MIICGGDGRCAAVEEDDEEEEEEGEGGRSGRFESENHSKRFQNYTHLYMIYIYHLSLFIQYEPYVSTLCKTELIIQS